MPPRSKHGGRREGAGRPPTGKPRRVKIAITLDPDLLAEVDAAAKQRGESRSAVIESAVRNEFTKETPADD